MSVALTWDLGAMLIVLTVTVMNAFGMLLDCACLPVHIVDAWACRGKTLVTELYHANSEDEQQNGHDHQRQHYQNDLDNE